MSKQSSNELTGSLFDFSAYETAVQLKPKLEVKAKLVSPSKIEALHKCFTMIITMIDVTGLPAGNAISLFELAGEDLLTLEQKRYLAGPISVHQNQWTADCEGPTFEWLRNACYKERMEMVMQEVESGESKGLASAAEVSICMYPATVAAPMHYSTADVYLWATGKTVLKHKGIDTSDISGHLTYEAVKFEYEILAREIRRKVVAAAQSRVPTQKPKQVADDFEQQGELLVG